MSDDGFVGDDALTGADVIRAGPLLIALGVSAASILPTLLAGALAAFLKTDFGVKDGALGVTFALSYGIAGVAAVSGGRLVDTIGWRGVVRLSSIMSAVALIGIGGLAHTYLALTGFLFIAGLSTALAGPASALIVVSEMPRRRQGFLFGVRHTASAISSLVSGLSVPVIALTIGWRWAFLITALVPMGVALTVPRVSRSAPARLSPRSPDASPRPSVVSRPMILLTVGAGFGMFIMGAVTTFGILTAVNAGLPVGLAGMIVAISSLVGLGVRVGGGWLMDHLRSNGLVPVTLLLGVAALGCLLLASGRALMVAPGLILAYGAGWGWNGMFFLGVVQTHADRAASAAGFAQFGVGIGAALGPLVFGVLASGFGYELAWIVIGLSALLGAALVHSGSRRLTHSGSDGGS